MNGLMEMLLDIANPSGDIKLLAEALIGIQKEASNELHTLARFYQAHPVPASEKKYVTVPQHITPEVRLAYSKVHNVTATTLSKAAVKKIILAYALLTAPPLAPLIYNLMQFPQVERVISQFAPQNKFLDDPGTDDVNSAFYLQTIRNAYLVGQVASSLGFGGSSVDSEAAGSLRKDESFEKAQAIMVRLTSPDTQREVTKKEIDFVLQYGNKTDMKSGSIEAALIENIQKAEMQSFLRRQRAIAPDDAPDQKSSLAR